RAGEGRDVGAASAIDRELREKRVPVARADAALATELLRHDALDARRPGPAAGGETAGERRRLLLGRGVPRGSSRQKLAEAPEQGLRIVGRRPALARRAPLGLLECGARLGGDLRQLDGGGEVLRRLLVVTQVEEGEAAAVEAFGVDLRHLVHEEEAGEAF